MGEIISTANYNLGEILRTWQRVVGGWICIYTSPFGGTQGLPRIRISLKCLALNSGYSILSTGGGVGVTFVYLRGRLDPWGTCGKFWAYPCVGGRIEWGPEPVLDFLFICGILSCYGTRRSRSSRLPVGAASASWSRQLVILRIPPGELNTLY